MDPSLRSRLRGIVLLGALLFAEAAPALAATGAESSVRARLVPRREAVLSSERQGRIVEIAVEPGQRFTEGDLLVQLDCAEQEASLRGAQAVLKGANRVEEARRKLAKIGSVSELDVAVAESEAARARAEVTLIEAQLSKCRIHAPFSGRVVERYAQPAETVAAGQKLLAVLDDRSLQIELLVPSVWLAWLSPGSAFDLVIDENGRTYRAQVRMLGARIDAVSQSLPVVADFVEPPTDLLAGMSGSARFHAAGQ